MILLCYDGSDDARAAIEHAGRLLPGQTATVLTVWEPFTEVLTRSAYGFATNAVSNIEEIDAATLQAAKGQAEAGTKLARDAGLDATPRTSTQVGTTADAILATARELDAEAIVVGSRGLTGLKSLLLGSVSHALIQHADRTVIVVPSASVAVARADHALNRSRHEGTEADPEAQPAPGVAQATSA